MKGFFSSSSSSGDLTGDYCYLISGGSIKTTPRKLGTFFSRYSFSQALK